MFIESPASPAGFSFCNLLRTFRKPKKQTLRSTLLLLFICISASLQAQTKKDSLKWMKDTIALAPIQFDSTGVITYKLIENVPSVSKNELFNRAKIWAALAFNDARNVTQLEDKESGSIIIKALSRQSYHYKFWGTDYPIEYYLHFSLQITIKEFKYRLILSNFTIETMPSLYMTSSKYPLERNYRELKEWNVNAKTGNMQFNKVDGRSPKTMKGQFEIVNNLDTFAKSTLNDAKAAMSKAAKADDF